MQVALERVVYTAVSGLGRRDNKTKYKKKKKRVIIILYYYYPCERRPGGRAVSCYDVRRITSTIIIAVFIILFIFFF